MVPQLTSLFMQNIKALNALTCPRVFPGLPPFLFLSHGFLSAVFLFLTFLYLCTVLASFCYERGARAASEDDFREDWGHASSVLVSHYDTKCYACKPSHTLKHARAHPRILTTHIRSTFMHVWYISNWSTRLKSKVEICWSYSFVMSLAPHLYKLTSAYTVLTHCFSPFLYFFPYVLLVILFKIYKSTSLLS